MDLWQSMAYFVAKELHMKPSDILTEWTCEELMVAYGYYANIHSNEYVETVPKKEWGKHKPPITWLDRWAVLFVDSAQMAELQRNSSNTAQDTAKETGIEEAARIIFG